MSHSWGRDGEDAVAGPPPEGAPPEPNEQESVTVSRLPSFGPPDDQYPKPPTAWEQPADLEPADPDTPNGADADTRTHALHDVPVPPPSFPAQPPYPEQSQYPAQQQYPAQPPYPAPQPFWGQEPSAPAGHPEQYPPPESGRHYAQSGAAPPFGPPDAPPSGPAPSTFPQHPVTPVRPARPEDLLVPNEAPVHDQPASWGWRGRVHRGTGGLVKPKASAQETAVREAIQRIQRGFSRPMTVVVVQPKGGAGKTPTTICLSAAFGAHRGGYVVGWDDNETRGTLAVRVLNPSSQTATAWDLLSDLATFERMDARVGDLSHYVRAQPDAHFDALVSDDHPGNMSQIGEDEFHRLHQVLQRFYRMVVVDTGNNVRSPNWQAAVSAADLVVVVSSYQRDVGYSGSWVLDHLAQTGREELARNAVTVLTAADPTTDRTVRTQLVEHFTNRTRAVAEIPYDPGLAHGGPIRWTHLAPATRNAWILAGATVVDALIERDQREQAARRAY